MAATKEVRAMPNPLVPISRRSFLSMSSLTAASAAFGLRMMTEPMLARAASHRHAWPQDGVKINANENPLGPCAAAREAAASIVAQGGRYCDWLTDDLTMQLAELTSLKPEYIGIYDGSTPPLYHSVGAFCSPQRTYITVDPGFEAGMFAAEGVGARFIKVPLAKDYSHDVRAMLAAGPNAGMFYICNPNNPTGTITSHSDLEYLVANKPKGSVVLVDEAYIQFSDATSVLDLVKADKDVIVIRTFSKIYGMAGLRCGAVFARPDLLDKVETYGGMNFMPITALAAASASLKDPQLLSERKRINADIRSSVFAWLDRSGYTYVPSQTNFFMLDTKRPGKETIDALATLNVHVGRIWPVWPTHVRVTVGTAPEMDQFQTALKKVMTNAVTASVRPTSNVSSKRGRGTRTSELPYRA